MKIHEVKVWPEYVRDIIMGRKNFEIRYDDRGYQVGHHVLLQEWDPDKKEYTGREILVRITYIHKDKIKDKGVLQKGFIVFSFVIIERIGW